MTGHGEVLPIDVYLVTFQTLGIPCGTDVSGCYLEDDRILTSWQALDHELVHAVAREIPFPSLFWEEGNAEMLAGKTTRKDTHVVLNAEDLASETLTTYVSAAHFSRYLVETRGWDRYRRAIRGEPLVEVYAEDATALTTAYERDAPYAYPPMQPCPFPELPAMGPGMWGQQVDIRCDAEDATQFEWLTFASAGRRGIS